MKNKQLKGRVNQLLVQIHRAFLSDKGEEYTDQQVLDNIPEDHLVPKHIQDDNTITVNGAFTYRWVYKHLKKDPSLTAYDLLLKAGFKHEAENNV